MPRTRLLIAVALAVLGMLLAGVAAAMRSDFFVMLAFLAVFGSVMAWRRD